MAMSDTSHLTELPDHSTAEDPPEFAGPDHPIRLLTRSSAFDDAWDEDSATRLTDVFDALAPEWSERQADPLKIAPVEDAISRGDAPIDGDWLEVGSGTGAGARILTPLVGSLICTDLSEQMLLHAPDMAPRVRSDAARLPFAANTFDAVLLINMLLFPDEIDRVLRPNATVVWVNTLGDQTPIHLPPSDVLNALPGAWTGVTARAGTGFWLTARRSPT